jgi:hypothetical protein
LDPTIAALAGVLLLLIALGILGGFLSRRLITPAQARQQFLQQREHLEADFFAAASTTGKPRGLRWLGCEWGDPLLLVRERQSGRLAALAAVTIRFEAVAGSDMEGWAAATLPRNGSAYFVHDGKRWHATSKAILNLTPDQVPDHLPEQFVRVSL